MAAPDAVQPGSPEDDEVDASPFQFVEVAPRRMTLSRALNAAPDRQDGDEDDDANADTVSLMSSASSLRPMTSVLTTPDPSTTAIGARTVLVKGYLKKTPHLAKPLEEATLPGWRRRYCELEDGVPLRLCYYRSHNKEQLKGIIHLLPDSQISAVDSIKHPHVFSIQSPRRLYYFKVEPDLKVALDKRPSQAEAVKNNWIASLTTEIQYDLAQGHFVKRGKSRMHRWTSRLFAVTGAHHGGLFHQYVLMDKPPPGSSNIKSKNKYVLVGDAAALAVDSDPSEEWLLHDFPKKKRRSVFGDTSRDANRTLTIGNDQRGILFLTAYKDEEPPMEFVCGSPLQARALVTVCRAADLSDMRRAAPYALEAIIAAVNAAKSDLFQGVAINVESLLCLLVSKAYEDATFALFLCQNTPGLHDLLPCLGQPVQPWFNSANFMYHALNLLTMVLSYRNEANIAKEGSTLEEQQQAKQIATQISEYVETTVLPSVVFLLFDVSKQNNTLLHSSLDKFFELVNTCVSDLQTAYTWCLQSAIEVRQLLNALSDAPAATSSADSKVAGQYISVLAALVGHMRPPKTEEFRRGVSAADQLKEKQRRQVITSYFRDHIVVRLFSLVMNMATKPSTNSQGMLVGFHGIAKLQQEAVFGLLESLLEEPIMAVQLCQDGEPSLAKLIEIMRLSSTQANYGDWQYKKLIKIMLLVFKHRCDKDLSQPDRATIARTFEEHLAAPLMELALDLSDQQVNLPVKGSLIELIRSIALLCRDKPILRKLCQPGQPAELLQVIHALRRPKSESSLRQQDVAALLDIFRCVVKHRQDAVIVDYLDTVLLTELLALCGDIPKQEFSGTGSRFPKTIYECTVELAKDAIISKMLCKNDDLFNMVLVLKGNASSDVNRESISTFLIQILASGAIPILTLSDLSQIDDLGNLLSWKCLMQPCGVFQHEDTPVEAHKTITSTYQHSLLPAMLSLLVESYKRDEGRRLLSASAPRARLADTCAALGNLSNMALEAIHNASVVDSLKAILKLIEDACLSTSEAMPVKPQQQDLLALMRVLFGFVRHAAQTATVDSFLATDILPVCIKLCVSFVDNVASGDSFLRAAALANFGPFEVVRLCTLHQTLAELCCTTHSKEMAQLLELFLKNKSSLHMTYQWTIFPIANLCVHRTADAVEQFIATTLLPISVSAMDRVFKMTSADENADNPAIATTLVAQFCTFPAAATRMATEIALGRSIPDAVKLLDDTSSVASALRRQIAVPDLLGVLVSLNDVVKSSPGQGDGAAQITRYLGRDVGNAIFGHIVTRLKAEGDADHSISSLYLPHFIAFLANMVESCPSAVIAEEICQQSDNLAALMRVLLRGTATQADADTLNVQFWGQENISKERLLELVALLYSSICQWCGSGIVSSAIFRTQPVPTLLKILERDYYDFPNFQLQALTILSRLALNSAEHCEVIYLNDGIRILLTHLSKDKSEFQKEAAVTLAFVISRFPERRSAFVKAGGMQPLIRLLNSEPAPGLRETLVLLISNCLACPEAADKLGLIQSDNSTDLCALLVSELVKLGLELSEDRSVANFQLILSETIAQASQNSKLAGSLFEATALEKLKRLACWGEEMSAEAYAAQAQAEVEVAGIDRYGQLINRASDNKSSSIDDSAKHELDENIRKQQHDDVQSGSQAEKVQSNLRPTGADIVKSALQTHDKANQLDPATRERYAAVHQGYLKRAVAGIELVLDSSQVSPVFAAKSQYRVMISHTWNEDDMRLSRKVRDYLRAHHIDYWFDEEHMSMSNNIYLGMAKALDECTIFLALSSPAYAESRNCNKELLRADELQRTIFHGRLNQRADLAGEVGLILGGGRFRYDLFIETLFEKNMAQLVQEIHRKATGEQLVIAPGSSSAPDPDKDPMEDRLRQALEHLNLTDYATALLREGVDDFETLCALSNEDLKGMGFKVGHIRKIEGLRADPNQI
eukprot:m.229456 g.229456  ORF g.229456 m.229456 type:complete len:1953 (-) comp17337_c0_seq1:65-5923(-)